MKLKLIVQRDDDTAVALSMTADATATVGDVADALHIGDPHSRSRSDGSAFTLAVRQSTDSSALDPEQSLIESGVRSGSTVRVVPAAQGSTTVQHSNRGRPVAMLRVVSGVDAGRQFSLPPGTSTVGSASTDHVVLNSPDITSAHVAVVVGESIEVIDHGSTNHVRIGGKPVSRALVGSSDIIDIAGTSVAIAHISSGGAVNQENSAIEFNRPPRVIARFDGHTIKAPEPPKRPEPNRLPLISMVAPVLLGIVLYAVTRNVLTILFIGLSPLLMIGMYFDTSRQAQKKQRIQVEQFAESLRDTAAQLQTLHNVERAVRRSETPSLADTIEAIHLSGPLLWTHRPEHSGFLTVRLGLGDAPSRVHIELPSRNDTITEYWTQVRELHDQFSTISDVPIIADFRSSGALGICGPRQLVGGVARGVVLQIAGLHSPAELTLTALVSETSRPSWEWLEWLPHVGSVHSPLAGDHLADDSAGGTALLSRIDALVSDRRTALDRFEVRAATAAVSDANPSTSKPAPRLPIVVVLIENDAPVDRSKATRLAELGADVGVHVVWVASQLASLPAACRTYLLVDSGTGGSTSGEIRSGTHTFPIACEQVDTAVAMQVAMLLSPVVDVGVSVDDQTDLPDSIPFLSLTGEGIATRPDSVLARWQASDSIADRTGTPQRRMSEGTLRAPVGSNGVDTFWLDLREHGPHALVGGTTGAGKSEFLQAWILGMATEHSPDRVSFLFVDYKGGAAFADCADLPHTVGVVTDLSPHLVQRALLSLRAELKWREELLNSKRAKDLLGLERTGDPDSPPSLVIIVDEFAALAKEIPEFVDGVVDIAQRGRSLGLHLVLATQRPAGVIKENLRANTNLRIALRMADADDSVDILGSPDAAYFPARVPGRAAAKIGSARSTAFQSGYTGGSTVGHAVSTPIEVSELRFGSGTRWDTAPVVEAQPERAVEPTDITRVVRNIVDAARAASIPPPRRPWLPELRGAYDLAELVSAERTDRCVLGVSDDAATQSQPVAYFDPDADGNMAVFGTGGSGKSTALRSIAVSALTGRSGQSVEIYGIDSGANGLRMIERLPQVGAIITGDDDERVGRLLRRLVVLVDDRAQRFGATVSNLADYRTAQGNDSESRVILLLDGLTNFRNLYEASTTSPWYDLLVRVATDGRSVGVHVVVSVDRPTALPTALAALVQRRLVLRLADADDYALAGIPRGALSAASPPGRGYMDGEEVQIAVAGGSADLAVQAAAVARLADESKAANTSPAPGVESLTEYIRLDDLPAGDADRPVIGVDDTDLLPFGVVPAGVMMLTGPPGSGRTSALHTLAAAVTRADPAIRTVLLTPMPSVLSQSGGFGAFATGIDDVTSRAADFAEHATSTTGDRLMVVIESVTSFHGTPAEPELLRLIKACTAFGHLVVGEAELSTWNGAYQLAPPFKAARRGIALSPGDIDTDSLFGTPLGRRKRAALIPGRGYFLERGRATKIQLALVTNETP